MNASLTKWVIRKQLDRTGSPQDASMVEPQLCHHSIRFRLFLIFKLAPCISASVWPGPKILVIYTECVYGAYSTRQLVLRLFPFSNKLLVPQDGSALA